MSTVAVLGSCAGTVSVLGSWPQVLRLARGRTAAGVSTATALMQLLACAGWLTYGALIADGAQVLTNVACLVPFTAVMAYLLAHARPALLPLALVSLAWSGAVAATGVATGGAGVGVLCVALSLVMRVPQLREVFLAKALVGLSPATCGFAALGSALWTTYGLLNGDVAVVASSVVALAINSVVLARRCPPRRVLLATADGRFGAAPALAVRPLVALAASGALQPARQRHPAGLAAARPGGVSGSRIHGSRAAVALSARRASGHAPSPSWARRPPSLQPRRPAPAAGPSRSRTPSRSSRH